MRIFTTRKDAEANTPIGQMIYICYDLSVEPLRKALEKTLYITRDRDERLPRHMSNRSGWVNGETGYVE